MLVDCRPTFWLGYCSENWLQTAKKAPRADSSGLAYAISGLAAVTGGRRVSHPPAISESQRGAVRAVGLLGAPFRPLGAALGAWRPGGARPLDGAPFRGVAAVVCGWRRRPRTGDRRHSRSRSPRRRIVLWRRLLWLQKRERGLQDSMAVSWCGPQGRPPRRSMLVPGLLFGR